MELHGSGRFGGRLASRRGAAGVLDRARLVQRRGASLVRPRAGTMRGRCIFAHGSTCEGAAWVRATGVDTGRVCAIERAARAEPDAVPRVGGSLRRGPSAPPSGTGGVYPVRLRSRGIDRGAKPDTVPEPGRPQGYHLG